METDILAQQHTLLLAQQLRLRRSLMAAGAGLANSSVIFSAWWLGYLDWSSLHLTSYIAITCLVCLLFPLLISSRLNLRFRDPSLTHAQISWHLLLTVYAMALAPDLRSLLVINLFLILLFAVFRYTPRRLPWLAAAMGVCYLIALVFSLSLRSSPIDWRYEWLVGQVVLLGIIGISLIGGEIAGLRAALKRRNTHLAEAMHKIEELAVTDELTGLYNRRHLLRILRRQKGLSDRGQYDFSIGFIDLDYFKQINDTFGHDAGDLTLQKVAATIRASLRDVDYVARLGGEEFVIVLAQTSPQAAHQIAERLRQDLEALIIHLEDERPDIMLTASIGLASYQPKESIEDLMRRADQALYAAKECGRNCIIDEADLVSSPLVKKSEPQSVPVSGPSAETAPAHEEKTVALITTETGGQPQSLDVRAAEAPARLC